ncbi:MAG TPA: hypothetical protein VK760_10125 [Candidatus Acidoferrales bacterium]|nr:hypothetical protein [Candidatus Acidoferrales bacterium]
MSFRLPKLRVRAQERADRTIAVVLLVAMLSACAQGRSTPSLAPGTAPISDANQGALVKLEIAIPHDPRRANYVSRSTRSIVVREGTHRLGAFNTTDARDCAPRKGETFCQFRIGVAIGPHERFVVSAFDRRNGTGNMLSRGHLIETIRPGLNVIPVTLAGFVSSIEVALGNPSPPSGYTADIPVVVMAKDADGNVIIGEGKYQNVIALTNSNTTGIAALSAAFATRPDQTISLHYTGRSIGQVTIGASAKGVDPAQVTPAVLTPGVSVVGDFELAPGASNGSQEPTAIASGPDGNLWVGVASNPWGILKMTTAGTMTMYTAGIGSILPPATISGLAAGTNGNVWYVSFKDVGFITPAGVATDYYLSGSTVCPGVAGQRIVAAAAADGGMWFTATCKVGAQVIHIARDGTTAGYYLPGIRVAYGLTLAKDGSIYVAGQIDANGDAGVARATVAGSTVSQVTVLDVTQIPNLSLLGIAQSADGDVWATTGSCSPSAFVRIHPVVSLSSSPYDVFPTRAGCSKPAYLTALADGTLWAPNAAYPIVTRVVPGVYPAAPGLDDTALPSAPTIPGSEWDAALGPDGNLYIVDASTGSAGYSGDVAKVTF